MSVTELKEYSCDNCYSTTGVIKQTVSFERTLTYNFINDEVINEDDEDIYERDNSIIAESSPNCLNCKELMTVGVKDPLYTKEKVQYEHPEYSLMYGLDDLPKKTMNESLVRNIIVNMCTNFNVTITILEFNLKTKTVKVLTSSNDVSIIRIKLREQSISNDLINDAFRQFKEVRYRNTYFRIYTIPFNFIKEISPIFS